MVQYTKVIFTKEKSGEMAHIQRLMAHNLRVNSNMTSYGSAKEKLGKKMDLFMKVI